MSTAGETKGVTRNAAREPRKARAATVADARRVEVKTLVKPVSNAINILRFLAAEGRPATSTQIARHLGINASTCFNILRTLAHEGMVSFDNVAKTYGIGLELGKLAGTALQQGERLSAARPLLHDFAEEFGVTMALWRRVGSDRMVLTIVEHSSSALSIVMREGQRLPVLLGSSGRVVATHLGLTKRQVQKEFKSLRWASPLSFETFWEEAERATEVGWATDRGNFAAGIQTVAAPVYEPGGRIAFTAVAFMFLGQYGDDKIVRMGESLTALGRELSRTIY
ncbi:IclR family transcriptional regulator [Novosphingobium album (ex Liu et al. 2023)]|uniref:Helix-turn-helix domain-containing protein n=1 Tax=Novosphingobium album (ex Liu et al. 2023) TaxID=3031130 RepID=A0ABT5WXD7_9SPHN|nr:helix-turn-helix domain-containing protein [Novosphingobium album (ex Liu et al. 2023)]MDE8654516.1 helix-turn-helix domain-containing protein [Novosphingobium album (ex Liu et al. 2023)]